MPLNVFEDLKSIGWRLWIIIFAQEPQTTGSVLIDQRFHALHQFVFVLIHYD